MGARRSRGGARVRRADSGCASRVLVTRPLRGVPRAARGAPFGSGRSAGSGARATRAGAASANLSYPRPDRERVGNSRRLWHLFVGTRGGIQRARLVRLIEERPYNANELATSVRLDYKTVRYHLRVLVDNDVLVASEDRYGTLYFWSASLTGNREAWRQIWESVEKNPMISGREGEEHGKHAG